MTLSFMTGSIVGKGFYKQVTTREADDGNGWNVMLDYRTLKTASKRPLKLPTLALAKAVAAEWEYRQTDGIRPFAMPPMKLACTSLESEEMLPGVEKMVFTKTLSLFSETQVKKIDPLHDWVNSELGFKPIVYSSFFGGKQEVVLVKAIENLLKTTDDCELAAIYAIAAAYIR